MKGCELCEFPARMYCESDQASLCWDCDAKVHCANFLVARHLRSLLCQICQSETPWKASGAKLGPTVSVCQNCVNRCNGSSDSAEEEDKGENEGEDQNEEDEDDDDDDDDDNDDDDDDDDGEGEEDDDDEKEDGDNQVVPWASTTSSFTSAPVASSSSEESSSRLYNVYDSQQAGVSLKRLRENAAPASQEDVPGCSSSQTNCNQSHSANEEDEATSYGPCRPSKDWKKASSVLESPQPISDSRASLVDALKRLQQEKRTTTDASAAVLDVCKLSKDPRPFDVVSTGSESPPP